MTINNVRNYKDICNLIQPVHSASHRHTLLIDSEYIKHTDDGKDDIVFAERLAYLRWAGGAKQLTLTKFELPPDAKGTIYTIDAFIGEVVDVRYTDWASEFRRNGRAVKSAKSGIKRAYREIGQIHLEYSNKNELVYRRPMLHQIVAYTYPPLREQYVYAVLQDMRDKGRDYSEAVVQPNHMDKITLNAAAYDLEWTTGTKNIHHRRKTTAGIHYSMLCEDKNRNHVELRAYDACGITDARDTYVRGLCKQLSDANIDKNAATINIVTVSGKQASVFIGGLTIWGILTKLFEAQAVGVVAPVERSEIL